MNDKVQKATKAAELVGATLLFVGMFWVRPFYMHRMVREVDHEEDKALGREKHPGWCW